MTVWATTPVEEQPEITLVNWHVFETCDGGRHFCGYNREDREGRVSSRIPAFDVVRMTGRTASGRTYRLKGRPGRDEDGLYVRARWWAMSGMPGEPVAVDVLQEWHGYVLDVGERGFSCRLVDVTAGDATESAEAVVPLASVEEAERALVREGAYFRWTVRGTPGGPEFDFASTPKWTREELDAAKARGAELAAALADLQEK